MVRRLFPIRDLLERWRCALLVLPTIAAVATGGWPSTDGGVSWA